MIQSNSAGHAKAYFAEALNKEDYYLDDQELRGRMQGRLAERLGIDGPVNKEVFHHLCDNINPVTGQSLTPNTRENRITGYDISFSCPKSVSILHGLSNDDHILTAFQESVRQTMQDIERDSKTRVRKNGVYNDRDTGELIWSEFVHQTARPLDGSLPDPQLHAHCFVHNATWDEAEQKIKAARFTDTKRDMPYYQEMFFKRLSDKLMDGGYQVRRTDKSFEIDGVPQRVIDLFSKRSEEINRVAKEKGISDPDELSELGARTRARKQKGHSMAELKANWRQQIDALGPDDSGEGKRIVRHAFVLDKGALTPQICVDHAIGHGFERASVQSERRLLASAYRHSIGHQSVSLEQVTTAFQADNRLVHVEEKGRIVCTTKQVLSEEQGMVNLARQGQGKLKPLYDKAPDVKLDGQQADAVRHVLTTPHRVSIIRGAAGSGKTTLMKEAVDLIEKSGKTVTVVAPTAQASRGVLREEGFSEAQTVAQLLADPKMQQGLQGQVLWCDEAGLLGTKDMTALLEITTRQNARLILGGDTRQHSGVVRGDALRILNTVAGIKTAEVSRIYRQRGEDYRSAVEDLSKGDVAKGFETLDRMGAIETIDPLRPNDQLVNDYVDTIRKGKSALIVSPTHKQADSVTDAVRQKMQERGLLSKKEVSATRLNNLNLTEAERSDWRNFQAGQVILFNQNLPGIKRGSRWTVERSTEQGVTMQNEQGQSAPLPTVKSSHYDVYHKSDISLAKGDSVRITRNGFDQDKTRLDNGQTMDVVKVSKQGDVLLRNALSKVEYRLDKEFGHIAHNYCVTSHASQGKTTDEVFISLPASTFAATNAKQFYVSVSRGRDRVRIYTDDKEQLLVNASEMGDRQSAIELVSRKYKSTDLVQQRIRDDLNRSPAVKEKPKEVSKKPRLKDRNYEPGL
ncbi:MobF family relaxase [Spirosoma endophyticum]|uniref:Conjugative relaxase domain-containing protein, TrwC/TraI family n=1 Tax=Spirosoma endophyticum TaxID=662367 RepID=A0A1I2GE31_9BACT|nr:MobF family relaxase [Spirosoma endophyticum]SFF14911.1 conjugative relaxase domain-containing protein, TrwC/TraI family [Spirosoma endophyticum]